MLYMCTTHAERTHTFHFSSTPRGRPIQMSNCTCATGSLSEDTTALPIKLSNSEKRRNYQEGDRGGVTRILWECTSWIKTCMRQSNKRNTKHDTLAWPRFDAHGMEDMMYISAHITSWGRADKCTSLWVHVLGFSIVRGQMYNVNLSINTPLQTFQCICALQSWNEHIFGRLLNRIESYHIQNTWAGLLLVPYTADFPNSDSSFLLLVPYLEARGPA